MPLPELHTAYWFDERRQIHVQVCGTDLTSHTLAHLLDPFAASWDGDVGTLIRHLERSVGRRFQVSSVAARAAGRGSLIGLTAEPDEERHRIWSDDRLASNDSVEGEPVAHIASFWVSPLTRQ